MRRRFLLLLASTVFAAACRQEMYDQPRYKALGRSKFFSDQRQARPPVEGTVARGMLRADSKLYAGKDGNTLVAQFPLPVTRALLDRGRQRFDIYCAPCHDRTGSGNGMVVQRGYRPPPSFHLERLRVYASDKDTWHALDALAFETIPLAREVRAIRRAVTALEDELAPEERKPWWICTVHAAGEFPEERPEGGGRLGAKEVLASYFDAVPSSTGDGRHESVRYAVPDAFGINCTATMHVASAVAAASDVLAQTGAARVSGGQPWLVLKPNGGQKYDLDTREWDRRDSEIWSPGDEWARQVGDIVHAAAAKGVWGGILVGGCCKTGDREVRALSKVL